MLSFALGFLVGGAAIAVLAYFFIIRAFLKGFWR